MKPTLFTTLFFLSGLCLLHAGETVSDLDRMQGIWQVASLLEEGKDVPKAETDLLEIVITKEHFTVSKKNVVLVRYGFKLDPTKTPKAVDFLARVVESKDNKDEKDAPKEKLVTEMGIYAFEKDTLKVVIDEEGKNRPAGFEGKDVASCSVMVLKRKIGDKDAK